MGPRGVHSRNNFGSIDIVPVQPGWLRFNRNGFGSTETVSVVFLRPPLPGRPDQTIGAFLAHSGLGDARSTSGVEWALGSPVGQQTVLENRQIRLTLMTPSVIGSNSYGLI